MGCQNLPHAPEKFAASGSATPNICCKWAKNMGVSFDVSAAANMTIADHHEQADQESRHPALPVEADPQRQQKHRIVDRAERQANHRSGDQRPAVKYNRPDQ